MLERAEKVRFPIAQYDGSDLSEKVGKIIVTDNSDQWFFKNRKLMQALADRRPKLWA